MGRDSRRKGTYMDCAWKPQWGRTRQHFLDWWNRDGLLLGMWGAPRAEGFCEPVENPGRAPSIKAHYTDAEWRARRNHYTLARRSYCADTFPVADTDMGPGSLATFLGSEPGFSSETVWFHPCIDAQASLDDWPPLRFDPGNPWWKLTEDTLKHSVALGRGKYFVGCPDLIENIDILASLRGTEALLHDMLERPEWVSEKVLEINEVWFEAYERIYHIIKSDDGGSVYGPFRLWGPGKTVKVQCDACAMFSPAMFERFVVPALTTQCEGTDHSMFHLDGHQCMDKLDALLAIDALDAIEWTPDPQVPSGGDPAWYGLYRRILDAGKSVQAIVVQPHEVIPLLDAVGGKGMYILTFFNSPAEAEELLKQAEPYR